MSWEYTELAVLERGHASPITAVAISPQGTRIASASLDGEVCIWDISSQKPLYIFHGQLPTLTLKWIPEQGEDGLLYGMDCGYLASLSFSAGRLEVYGFKGHSHAVDCLDLRSERVASGAQNEIRVWEWEYLDQWRLCAELPEPQANAHTDSQTVTVTSIRWTSCGTRLIATYLQHGARIYDTETWECLQTIAMSGQTACADLSCDDRRLAVSNVVTGFDLYALSSGHLLRAFGQDAVNRRATPVRFIESGSVLVGGTTVGEIVVWDLNSGCKLQTLIPGGANLGFGVILYLTAPRR
ncbi:WD40-repeat-containing domain protein [Trametes meyenii]|nr:WD40-repeat-containing domain protein [Trametes meyenii]